MTKVSVVGGNTVTINTGSSSYILNDKNNNGVMDSGDVLIRAAQDGAQLTTAVLGSNEAMNLHGDPHLDNLAFADGGTGLMNAANQAFQQARTSGTANVAGIEQAITGAARDNIGDIHADAALKLSDGTLVEAQMAYGDNKNIAYTENADINLTDASGRRLSLTIKDIWNGNGGGGAMQVLDTTHNTAAQAVADGRSVPTFHELDGANVLYGTVGFGTDFGTKDHAYILPSSGKVDLTQGQQNARSLWGHAVMSSFTSYTVARSYLVDNDNELEHELMHTRPKTKAAPV